MTEMKERIRLHELPPGKSACIEAMNGRPGIKRRLIDVGFTPGAAIRCLYRSVAGDPTAYWIRGTVIALRAEDAAGITVRTAEEGSE